MQRTKVESGNLESVGYDPETETLEVEFTKGAVYQYHGVPPVSFSRLMAAKSRGQFLHTNIKGAFKHSRVD